MNRDDYIDWIDWIGPIENNAEGTKSLTEKTKSISDVIKKYDKIDLNKKMLAIILREFRHELNISKKELADITGLPYSVLNNIENERASFTWSNLVSANHKFNDYVKYHKEDFDKEIIDNAFGLCMLNALRPKDIYNEKIRYTHSLGTMSLAQSLNNVIDMEKERVYETYKKLSETDQNKIMERMEYIISTYEDEENIPTKRIAVLGQTACGNPIEAISIADEFIETNELKATFALRAVGDSMSPLINDGDVILIKQTEELEVSDIGIFQINETGFSDDEEVTCKMLKSIKDGVMTLVPLNPAHDPIIVDTKKNHVKVIGKYLGRA